MDLSILHPIQSPERDYSWKDKLNSVTGNLECHLLEWTGWYNQDILQRLLGHYRLYQAFKSEDSFNNHLSPPLHYITNYKVSHSIKYFISCITASLYFIFSFGKRYTPLQTESINRKLINDKAIILYEFLEEADQDFSNALRKAVERISSPNFFDKSEMQQLSFFIQNKNEFNQYQTNSHYFNEYNQVVSSGISGKEKGVFSKKQLLILFDLLAENQMIDCIDYSKLNKFDSIANMLHAISAKSKESIVEQLKDVNHKGLYSFSNIGELNQLIITITNLADTFRKAGFRAIAVLADKKLRFLEKEKAICIKT